MVSSYGWNYEQVKPCVLTIRKRICCKTAELPASLFVTSTPLFTGGARCGAVSLYRRVCLSDELRLPVSRFLYLALYEREEAMP